MPIHWFPGHMNRARKDIAEALRQVDVVIELVDARLPLSSRNPLLAKLLGRSATSLRAYAKGRRPVPQLVALRLEWLLAVVYDLEGGYNSIGMRAWFGRPRPQLGGRSPLAALGHDWQPSWS